MKIVLLTLLSVTVVLSSCKKEKIEGEVINDPEFAQELRASPEDVTIDDNALILTTYLWRDFMPIPEENGSKMICVNKLIEIDSLPLLSTIELKKQYVIKGNEIWTSEYHEVRDEKSFILEGTVKDGPKWGPNIEVDVVCEFESSGTLYRIIAKSQMINKTQ